MKRPGSISQYLTWAEFKTAFAVAFVAKQFGTYGYEDLSDPDKKQRFGTPFLMLLWGIWTLANRYEYRFEALRIHGHEIEFMTDRPICEENGYLEAKLMRGRGINFERTLEVAIEYAMKEIPLLDTEPLRAALDAVRKDMEQVREIMGVTFTDQLQYKKDMKEFIEQTTGAQLIEVPKEAN